MYIVHVWLYEFRKSTDFYAAVPIGLVISGPLNIGVALHAVFGTGVELRVCTGKVLLCLDKYYQRMVLRFKCLSGG
jgi:hypothetical protein